MDSKFKEQILEITLKEIKELINENKIEFQSSPKNTNTFRTLRRELGITLMIFKTKH